MTSSPGSQVCAIEAQPDGLLVVVSISDGTEEFFDRCDLLRLEAYGGIGGDEKSVGELSFGVAGYERLGNCGVINPGQLGVRKLCGESKDSVLLPANVDVEPLRAFGSDETTCKVAVEKRPDE